MKSAVPVEALRLGISLDEPFVVTQWGSLLAVSYAARAFGISRQDKIREARAKCPNLKYVHTMTYAPCAERPQYHPPEAIHKDTHKVSLETYRNASKRIFNVLSSFEPDALEKAGIDEAFLDITTLAANRAAKFHGDVRAALREVQQLPVGSVTTSTATFIISDEFAKQRERDAREKLRLEMQKQEKVANQNEETAAASQQQQQPENHPSAATTTTTSEKPEMNYGDDSDAAKLLLLGGALVCQEIRNKLREELGYRCSAGISANRRISKSVSAVFKPNQQALVFPSLGEAFLRSVPISKARGFGGKLGAQLSSFFGAQLTGDLIDIATLPQLTQCLGGDAKAAREIYDMIRGREVEGDVVKNRVAPKMMMAQKIFTSPLADLDTLDNWFTVLSAELSNRINEGREEFEITPQCLNIKFGTNDTGGGGDSYHYTGGRNLLPVCF